MAEPNYTQSFVEVGPRNRVQAGYRGAQRTGVFAVKIGTNHRYRLEFDVGDNPVGTVVYQTVQSFAVQPADVQAAATWRCTHPECKGERWPSKEAAVAGHPAAHVLDKLEEGHCLIAVSKLPPDVADIVGVACKGDSHVFVTVDRRIDIPIGARVVIANVLTRERDDEGKYVPHACNGVWRALPVDPQTIGIECDGYKARFFLDPKSPKPTVVLSPERPILLSDEA